MVEPREPAVEPEEQQQPRPTRPPVLLVMVGPPGTGKSHLVRLLAERIPLQVVETDEIRRQIAPSPTYSHQENRRVFHLAHRKIDRLLRQGKNVVFDATNIHESGRRTVFRIAENDGARLLIVRTVAPDEVVAERLLRRQAKIDKRDRSEADWEVYARMKAEYEEIGRPHMVVDTSQDLEPALEEILSSFREQK